MTNRAFASLVVLGLLGGTVSAQSPPPVARIRSPEVHPDGRVTFRFRAPNAKEVLLARDGADHQPMQRDDEGLWTVTTGPLEPDFYGYRFVADGVGLVDPSNPEVKPNLLGMESMVHVPGPTTLPWEVAAVPHGAMHRHFYRSAVAGDDREFYVYTPPSYDARAATRYPALYLLHGFSDDPSAWTVVGRAHVILDNLIARGDTKPMLVVMPLGYGTPAILEGGFASIWDPRLRRRNAEKFREVLLQEVVPAVEKTYRITARPAARAIAGLSMGGGQSLLIGLQADHRFAWIGAFSSAVFDDLPAMLPALDASANARLRLVWIACGKEDRFVDDNRKLEEWLRSRGIRHIPIETAGGHTWMVWRRNLAAFAPLLFR